MIQQQNNDLTWRLNNLHVHTFLKNEYRIPLGLITDLGPCNFPVQTDHKGNNHFRKKFR